MGKAVAVIYALIGVPLMLILLSTLGTMLASGARKTYTKLCCQHETPKNKKNSSVGYYKTPTSSVGKLYCKTHDGQFFRSFKSMLFFNFYLMQQKTEFFQPNFSLIIYQFYFKIFSKFSSKNEYLTQLFYAYYYSFQLSFLQLLIYIILFFFYFFPTFVYLLCCFCILSLLFFRFVFNSNYVFVSKYTQQRL